MMIKVIRTMIKGHKHNHGEETQIQHKEEGSQRSPHKGDDFNPGLKGCIGFCHMEKGGKVILGRSSISSGFNDDVIPGRDYWGSGGDFLVPLKPLLTYMFCQNLRRKRQVPKAYSTPVMPHPSARKLPEFFHPILKERWEDRVQMQSQSLYGISQLSEEEFQRRGRIYEVTKMRKEQLNHCWPTQ